MLKARNPLDTMWLPITPVNPLQERIEYERKLRKYIVASIEALKGRKRIESFTKNLIEELYEIRRQSTRFILNQGKDLVSEFESFADQLQARQLATINKELSKSLKLALRTFQDVNKQIIGNELFLNIDKGGFQQEELVGHSYSAYILLLEDYYDYRAEKMIDFANTSLYLEFGLFAVDMVLLGSLHLSDKRTIELIEFTNKQANKLSTLTEELVKEYTQIKAINEMDTTEYLLSGPANKEHLLKAIDALEKGGEVYEFTPEEFNKIGKKLLAGKKIKEKPLSKKNRRKREED
jgi:hypothetical protein